MSADPGPDAVCAAALAGLPGMGPASLASLLAGFHPAGVWDLVLAGDVTRPARGRRGRRPAAGGDLLPSPLPVRSPTDDARLFAPSGPPPVCSGAGDRTWLEAARSCDLDALATRLVATGTGVTWAGRADYPRCLSSDPEPPGVLFWRGALAPLDGRCVAIVGTRRCSPDGRRVAWELGRDLGGAGLCVVSGLALGIDAGAHLGALAAPAGSTVGVAASGVDVPYPAQHSGMWEEVVARGAVLSETAPGQPAQAWRFPARNRVIAGLVQLVVVVESHEAGGSMLTVDAALARGVDVGAVPGPVHSLASTGTNRLLVDGATPVRHAGDVLDHFGLAATPGPEATAAAGCRPAGRPRPPRPEGPDRQVYQAVGWAPTSLGRVVDGAGLDLGTVGLCLSHLEELGLVEGSGGWWARLPPKG
ncbi:MAG: DNA-processing protein DprA [Acidimicrobiales bacterium]